MEALTNSLPGTADSARILAPEPCPEPPPRVGLLKLSGLELGMRILFQGQTLIKPQFPPPNEL